MPAKPPSPAAPVTLVWGDDDFAVGQRARALFQQWCAEIGGMDHEIIDAAAGNSAEALKAIARLREALQTLPFFGSGKVVWFKGCNFLSDERTAGAQAVTEALTSLAQELKEFTWDNVRLLISAGKVDKRKVLYKALEKLGGVEAFAGLSIDDRDWAAQAETAALSQIRALGKRISDTALSELVANVGPNLRQLIGEIDKAVLYVGDREEIGSDDVAAVVTRNKQARAFALGDALGDRDLPRLLRCLDEELWEVKFDSKKSEIGLLYGIIAKVRVLILLKEMLRAGWIRRGTDFTAFKRQLEHVPADALPADRRFSPLAMNPYVLFKALAQADRYTQSELVRAMDVLLESNRNLISSDLDEAIVLQRALVQIATGDGQPAAAVTARRSAV